MNRNLTIFLLINFIVLPALAMPPQEIAVNSDQVEKQQRKAPIEIMKEVLSLRDNQLDFVNETLKAEYVSMRELKRRNQLEQREQREAIHQQTIKKLSTVLDEQQLAQFEAFRKGMQSGRHFRNKNSLMNSGE